MNFFRSGPLAYSILILLFISFLIPTSVFAQGEPRVKSGAEKFLKWFTIGAMVAGAALGVATLGIAGLVIGPLIGAAAATLTGLIFQANPVDQWRAVVNKAPVYNNRNAFGMIHEIKNGENTSNAASFGNSAKTEPEENSALMEAFLAYQEAHKVYKDSVSSGDQTNIAEKAATLREAKAAYEAARNP